MKIHVIVDFMHIYYKYYFQLSNGRLKYLTSIVDGIPKDTSLVYYPLRDIESIRRQLENIGHDVTISVCFDTKSKRKEQDAEYKSGRGNRLDDADFDNLVVIQAMLESAGYNTYKIEGYEADDIVNYMVRHYADNFDYTIIYTNDKDLLINIQEKVGVMRFKQYQGYMSVDMKNYEEYLEGEFKTFIPYNMLGLYLSSVGDSADKIKGITKFGPKAFSKLLTKVVTRCGPEISKTCGDYSQLAKVIDACEEFLTEEQFKQLKDSFTLVSNIDLETDVPLPSKQSTEELRRETYEQLEFNSLIQ